MKRLRQKKANAGSMATSGSPMRTTAWFAYLVGALKVGCRVNQTTRPAALRAPPHTPPIQRDQHAVQRNGDRRDRAPRAE